MVSATLAIWPHGLPFIILNFTVYPQLKFIKNAYWVPVKKRFDCSCMTLLCCTDLLALNNIFNTALISSPEPLGSQCELIGWP